MHFSPRLKLYSIMVIISLWELLAVDFIDVPQLLSLMVEIQIFSLNEMISERIQIFNLINFLLFLLFSACPFPRYLLSIIKSSIILLTYLQQQYMLNRITKVLNSGFAIQKRLFVYDSGKFDPSVQSGIRATIFGPTGVMGVAIAGKLGAIGSRLVIPIAKQNDRYWDHPKELKLAGHTHKTWVNWKVDHRDQRYIEDLVRNSNVVINLIGPRRRYKKMEDFQYVNIDLAERIAQACNKFGVHRLIHFSAAGADPNSPSMDFQTKFEGQKAVKAAFPNATIFRPCTIYGQNDNFAHVILRQSIFFWHNFVLVYDNCSTLKQPIRDSDVATAVLNALKMEQTKGKTYELGGPHKLSMLQIHQIIFNTLNLNPALAYINPDLVMPLAKRIYNWSFFGVETINKKKIPEVVSGNYGTIQDLHVDPVSFKNGIFSIMRQYIFNPGLKDQDNQN